MAKDRDQDQDPDLEKMSSAEIQSASEEEGETENSPAATGNSVPNSIVEPEWADEEEDARRGHGGPHSPRHSEDSQRTEDDFHDHQVPPHRSRSHAQSSMRSVRPPAVKVPRDERRGLLARFCFIDEITNAWDYSNNMKWLITAIVAVAGAAAPMGSSIVLPALVDITRDFNSTATVANLSVAMYMLSMSIFPLWWSSFSETLGRRTIYVVSFFLFLVFNVLSAVSVNIGMFVVMRV